MLYELINPSDEITFMSNSYIAATIAVAMVGSGQYGANPLESEDAEKIPLFLFGGFEEWLKDNNLASLDEAVDQHKQEIINCLKSFALVGQKERHLYDLALNSIDDPEKKRKFLEEWDDKHRSSLNNIVGRAYAIAENLQEN